MLKYKWKLSDSQPEQEIPLLRLQQALAASSVFLDLAFQDGGIILTIAMDDTVFEKLSTYCSMIGRSTPHTQLIL